MDQWPVQDAKARFSEFLDKAIEEGPQIVTRRGKEEAVLVPIEQWREMEQAEKDEPNLIDIIMSCPKSDIDWVPKRGRRKRRPRVEFD